MQSVLGQFFRVDFVQQAFRGKGIAHSDVGLSRQEFRPKDLFFGHLYAAKLIDDIRRGLQCLYELVFIKSASCDEQVRFNHIRVALFSREDHAVPFNHLGAFF